MECDKRRNKITKKNLAKKLNGIEYPFRRSLSLFLDCIQIAKENSLVIAYGVNDDWMKFAGAYDKEFGCYGGKIFRIGNQSIEAIWDSGGYSWIYETDIEHATFDIMEDGKKSQRII